MCSWLTVDVALVWHLMCFTYQQPKTDSMKSYGFSCSHQCSCITVSISDEIFISLASYLLQNAFTMISFCWIMCHYLIQLIAWLSVGELYKDYQLAVSYRLSPSSFWEYFVDADMTEQWCAATSAIDWKLPNLSLSQTC